MSIQRTAATFVLGLMFVSLVVIYLLFPQNSLVTFLSILIMTISLIVTLNDRWRQIAAIAVLAALLSLIAAHFLGQARYGRVGSILVPTLWGLMLLLVFSWIQRNMRPVSNDRAIMIRNVYTNSVKILTPPLAPPLLPFIERTVAIIPLYILSEDVSVDKINTQTGHNIESLKMHVHFKVANRTEAGKILESLTNRGHALHDSAKEMGQSLEVARTDVMFWERIIRGMVHDAVDDVVRDVVFEEAKSPVDGFNRRTELTKIMKRRLARRTEHWGVETTFLEIDRIDVDPERFKSANKERIRKTETEDALLRAEREATRIRVTREAEAEAEAERIKRLVSALQESNVNLSPETLEEIVLSAIRSSADWEMETAFSRYSSEPPARSAGDQKGSGDKKSNGSK